MAEPATRNYLDPEVLARINRLGLKANRVVEGTISGLHRSPLHGVSPEFADHRQYTPGDDLKNLDWRVYARSDRYYIKRFEEESNLRATILLDTSASMAYQGKGGGKLSGKTSQDGGPNARPNGGGIGGWNWRNLFSRRRASENSTGGSPSLTRKGPAISKFDLAATTTACLSSLLMRQRDAVGLITFDTEPRTVLRPSAKKTQLSKITDTLSATTPGGETELGPVITQAADRIHRRGMVIVISDMLADLDELYRALGKLQYGGHEILVLQVLDRDEIDLPFDDSVIFRDIEPGQQTKAEEVYAEPWAFRRAYRQAMEQFIADIRRRCQYSNIDHAMLHTDEDLGLALSHYLHQRQRRGSY